MGVDAKWGRFPICPEMSRFVRHFGTNREAPPISIYPHLALLKKNEPKPKLLSPDIFRWGRGLPHEGVGAKKFGMPLETREIKLFWRDIPGFCRDIPGVPEKFEEKKFGFNFRSLYV